MFHAVSTVNTERKIDIVFTAKWAGLGQVIIPLRIRVPWPHQLFFESLLYSRIFFWEQSFYPQVILLFTNSINSNSNQSQIAPHLSINKESFLKLPLQWTAQHLSRLTVISVFIWIQVLCIKTTLMVFEIGTLHDNLVILWSKWNSNNQIASNYSSLTHQ